MNYNERIRRIEGEMNNNPYLNFNGDYDYANGDYDYALDPEYYPYNTVPSGDLNPLDRTLTVTVVSAAAGTETVNLFNSFADPTDANVPAGITITVQEAPGGSHPFLKQEIISNIITLKGDRFSVTTVPQLSNIWTLLSQDSTGQNISYPWQPASRRSAQNQITTQIDAADFIMDLNGYNSLQFDILAAESVTFTFYVKKKTQLKNVSKGRNIVAATNLLPPSGRMEVDLATFYGRNQG